MAPIARLVFLFSLTACAAPQAQDSAPAATAGKEAVDCQMQLATLGTQTESAHFGGNDRAALVDALDTASRTLTEGRRGEAVPSLTRYRAQVASLRSTHRLAAAEADALTAGVDAVLSCVREQ